MRRPALSERSESNGIRFLLGAACSSPQRSAYASLPLLPALYLYRQTVSAGFGSACPAPRLTRAAASALSPPAVHRNSSVSICG